MNDLKLETIELLKSRPRGVTLQMVATDTSISINWLKALLNNRIKDPGVGRITLIYNYLTDGAGAHVVSKHTG